MRTTKPEPGHKSTRIYLHRLAIAAEPGVGDGHYLHRDGARLRLPRRGARLVQPPRPGVAAVDYDGGGVLHRDAGGRLGALRQAEDIQHRPGLAVHWPNLRRRARRQWPPSAWTAKAPGATTCLSSSSGAASNTCICAPTTASSEARASIGRYFDFYNRRLRPHASLDGNTPDQAYFNPLPIRMAA